MTKQRPEDRAAGLRSLILVETVEQVEELANDILRIARTTAIELAVLLPSQLRLGDGEARIYRPCLDRDSDSDDHPLVPHRRTAGDRPTRRRFETAWRRGPKLRGRAEHAWRLLRLEADTESPALEELCESRYALVASNERYGRAFVTSHDSVNEACEYAGGEVHEGREPERIVDLDSGKTIVERNGFDVETIVTTDWTPPTLMELVHQRGVEEIDLHEVVHDVHSKQASEINNGGLAAQLQYLVRQLGEAEVEGIVREAKPVKQSQE